MLFSIFPYIILDSSFDAWAVKNMSFCGYLCGCEANIFWKTDGVSPYTPTWIDIWYVITSLLKHI